MSFAQVLLNFFSNDAQWKLSNRGIANSFGTKKNRDSIKNALDNLVELGYLNITDDYYEVNLNLLRHGMINTIGYDTNDTTNKRKEIKEEVINEKKENKENKIVNSTQSIELVNSNQSIVGEKTYEEKFEKLKENFGFTFMRNELPNLDLIFKNLLSDFINSSRLLSFELPTTNKEIGIFIERLKTYYNSNKAVYN